MCCPTQEREPGGTSLDFFFFLFRPWRARPWTFAAAHQVLTGITLMAHSCTLHPEAIISSTAAASWLRSPVQGAHKTRVRCLLWVCFRLFPTLCPLFLFLVCCARFFRGGRVRGFLLHPPLTLASYGCVSFYTGRR